MTEGLLYLSYIINVIVIVIAIVIVNIIVIVIFELFPTSLNKTLSINKNLVSLFSRDKGGSPLVPQTFASSLVLGLGSVLV